MKTESATLSLAALCALFGQAVPKKGDWPVYGRDAGAMRYSPLDQIRTTNVTGLRRAWTYHTGERVPSR